MLEPISYNSLNKDKPKVLVYHSHSTEAYDNSQDTKDKNLNVIGMGELLCKYLDENYGISAENDDTIYDAPYIDSYTNSRKMLQEKLSNYSGYDLIIDLHRNVSQNKSDELVNIEGTDTAKCLFVIDTSNKYYKENLKVVDDLTAISNKLFPGLVKGAFTYENAISHFNQDLNKNIIFLEIGSDKNSLEEAQNSIKCMAEVIAEYINNY